MPTLESLSNTSYPCCNIPTRSIELEAKINSNRNGNGMDYNSRSWIDVFAECGTVLGRILSFLDEVDVLQLEQTSERVTPNVTGPQWAYLETLDWSRIINKRWRQTPPQQQQQQQQTPQLPNGNRDSDDHRGSRLRGIEFAANAIYAKKRAEEAFEHFEFDRDNVTPEDIPVRHVIRLEATKDGRVEHRNPQPMPPCWHKWDDLDGLIPEGNETVVLDVFLDISFHRDNPSEILSWRGFRRARFQRYQGISLNLDLESLVEDMGWTELLDFRNKSHDYAFAHFEVTESQRQLKALMEKIQITLHRAESHPLDDDTLLLIATGGHASPAWARRGNHMVIARNANIGRFHCRNGTNPLEETFTDASRSTFLQIPTQNSRNQSLGIVIKMY
jgi:hypothetical protein